MYAYACYMYKYNITCRYMYTFTPAFYVSTFEYLSSYICEFFFFARVREIYDEFVESCEKM